MRKTVDLPIFTVGHSTRTIPQFVELVSGAFIQRVIDVRSVPRSRRNPQYNEDTLSAELAHYGLAYSRMADLGGLRGRSMDVAPAVNGFWSNQSFHNYADYALSDRFDAALGQLLAISSGQTCVIMCAEALWWQCHRRIIADHLIARGRRVFHLMGNHRIESAKLTSGAKVRKGEVIYPTAAS